jgi:Tfp pilus assembly protein PilF
MNDGFQSAYPPEAATISGGARAARAAGHGPASPEAGDPSPELPRRNSPSRAPPHPVPVSSPLPRWRDTRAELPALRAQLERAELDRDVERERVIAAALARALVKRRSELDIALRLGRRAVLLGDDSLRIELASWHCQLGQTELAVGMLVPLLESAGLDRARLSMRIALYHARLGDAEQALAALREAAAHDPDDPLIYELMATVHGWAPWVTSAERAAEAYLRGAAGRLQHKDTNLAFQDTLRAFDTAPAHAEAASALARAFEARKQPNQADEVWRRHAEALGEERFEEAVSVHRWRLDRQLAAGLFDAALASALDARLDASVEVESILSIAERARLETLAENVPDAASAFDWLLCKLGLWEPFAARLELACEAVTGKLQSRCWLELGHVLDQKLGNTERALEPWMAAVAADPTSEPARASLRRYAATTGDYSPWVEALVRVGLQDHRNAPEGAGECLRELWQLAEDRLQDPALVAWCLRRALRHEPRSEDLANAEQHWSESARRAEQELDASLAALSALHGEARVPLLRHIAAALRGFPGRTQLYITVLWELSELRPEELRFRRLLETLLGREDDVAGLSRLWTRDVTARDPNVALRGLMGLSRLERRAGNLQGSLAVLAADDGLGLLPAASMQLSLAAQLGSQRLRAEGLLKVAAGLEPGLRAWLASVASAELLALGELPAARAAAEVGTHADPSATRPIVAFANAAEGRGDRVAAVAYERAMALTFPSSVYCKALVSVLESLGEAYAAQVWTARWLGLRPAETAAATQLLRGSAKTGDAARLGDVIAWTVSQAHPLQGWAESLATALTCLADAERGRAAEVAWRILDAFGPEPPVLRQAILVVAEQSGDDELEVALLERELAADTIEDRDAALWRLTDLHFERGESDRAYAVLVRGLAAGLDARRVLDLITASPDAHSPEGEFHRLQARARAFELLGETSEPCQRALREYGAALWDLARDPGKAIEVWLRAAELGGVPGWFQFASDLVSVLGLDRALDEVCRLAENQKSPAQVAALLIAAAGVAKNMGGRRRALQLGLLALDTEPTSVWALEIIESSALGQDLPAVEGAYEAALAATLGSYGERALHYRAARFFERSGDQSLALSHAIAAFRAVPSEGVTFALMLRLAQGERDKERASRAVEDVAAEHPSGRLRSQWLRRAALIAAGGADGAQQRTEVLLRALLAEPDAETVDLLGRAFTDLARQQPDGRSIGHLRFSRAVTKLVPRLESVDGARVALSMASLALGCFSDAKLALAALDGAVSLEPELEEFSDFVPEAARLAGEAESAGAWVARVAALAASGQRGSLALLELGAEVALALGKVGVAASLLARRVERSPDDEALRTRAEQAVQKSRDLVLPPHVHDLFPTRALQAELLGRAERAQSDGDAASELAALTRAFQLESSLPVEQLPRLLELAGEQSQLPLVESALAALEASDIDAETLIAATQRVCALLMEHGRPQRALQLLLEASRRAPAEAELLTQALAAARAAGDDAARHDVLLRLIELTSDAAKKSLYFSEAWEVAKKRGQQELAADILRRWLDADPADTQALSRLEAECEARQDWTELVDLLGKHLALGVSFRERRRLVLRRSELLEGKLGRLEEARQELAALVEQAPADRAVVERLATVTELLGDRSAAGAAWLTASGLSSTRPAAAQLAERACRLFLDAGEVMAARRVLAAPQTLPRTLGLARLGVRLERDGENEPRLARALEELGAVEDQSARDRADAWLEAAGLWRRLADEDRAHQDADEAARLVPDDVDAQILASYLAYRRTSVVSRDDAEKVVERLRRVAGQLNDEQADLAAFLLAEALDAIEPEGAGLEHLLAARDRLGATPLVAVGIAERLARGPTPRAAFEHYDVALSFADLRGLRKPSSLALAAARTAQSAELFGLVHRYGKLAEIDPELADDVARLRERLPDTSPPSAPPKSAPAHSPPGRRPIEFMSAKPRIEENEPQTRPARRTQIGLGVPDARPSDGETLSSDAGPPRLGSDEVATQAPDQQRAWGRTPHHVDEPVERPTFVPRDALERERWAGLQGGSAQAGLDLCALLDRHQRSEELAAVAALLSHLQPAARTTLDWLRRSAEAVGDVSHASALEHVIDCSSVDRTHVPPPLERQRENVEISRRLLFSEPDGQYPEALEVIWQSTHRVLEWENVRGLEAAERSGADLREPFQSLWAAATRLFGLTATPLLRLPGSGDYRLNVVVLQQPAVLLRGEPGPDEAQVAYDIGAALAGTLPAHAIVNAATYEQIDDLFRAVASAFGPPEASRTSFTSTARLAALLWESVPPRTQRRMAEWCKDGKVSRDSAVASARRAARRAGLFACGDLAEALGRLVSDEGMSPDVLGGPMGLERLCEASRAATDLVRLATDPVYAHLRWRSEQPRPAPATPWRPS